MLKCMSELDELISPKQPKCVCIYISSTAPVSGAEVFVLFFMVRCDLRCLFLGGVVKRPTQTNNCKWDLGMEMLAPSLERQI